MSVRESADGLSACNRCAALLRSLRYEMRTPGGALTPHCLRCALMFAPMLRRSLFVAAIVGTILTAINQGNVILGGDFPASLYWKIPLTYCVPFCVATTGAILNARARLGGELRTGESGPAPAEAVPAAGKTEA